jgi:hypothetical protein
MDTVTFVINHDARNGVHLDIFPGTEICLPEEYFFLYLVVLKKENISNEQCYIEECGKSNLTDLSSDVSEILKTGGRKLAPIWSTHLYQTYQLIRHTRY